MVSWLDFLDEYFVYFMLWHGASVVDILRSIFRFLLPMVLVDQSFAHQGWLLFLLLQSLLDMIFTVRSCAVAVTRSQQILISSLEVSVDVVMKVDVRIIFEEQIMITRKDFINVRAAGRHCKNAMFLSV